MPACEGKEEEEEEEKDIMLAVASVCCSLEMSRAFEDFAA